MSLDSFSPITHAKKAEYRQSIIPSNLEAYFVGDDTDNHDFKCDGRGKGRMTVAVQNKTNKTVTMTVYGSHAVGADVGDDSVFQIGTFDVATTVSDYQTLNDPFPFYIVRAAFSATPDSTNVLINVNFSAF
jgi:hypothetical protein